MFGPCCWSFMDDCSEMLVAGHHSSPSPNVRTHYAEHLNVGLFCSDSLSWDRGYVLLPITGAYTRLHTLQLKPELAFV
jgi:hypothetical protein